ncbi:MAG: ribonuclease P protein component [Pirellulales bacterium]
MSDHSFDASKRLKSPLDFQRVFESGKVAANEMLVVHALKRDGDETRLGISISKKVGHAPLRNRWKRLIREAFRLQRESLPRGFDLVIRPKKDAEPDYERIYGGLVRLVQRASQASPRKAHRDPGSSAS